MGIQVSWVDDTHTCILLDFKGNWTWEDLRGTNEKTSAMLKSVPHVVDVINDLTNSGGLPNGALTEGRSMLSSFESGKGLALVVQAGGFVKSIYNVFQKLYGRRAGFPETHFFDTRDEAIAYVREQRGAESTD